MYNIRMLVWVVLMFSMVNGTAIGRPGLSTNRSVTMAGMTRIYIKDDGQLFAFSPNRDPADLTQYKAQLEQSLFRGVVVKNNDVDLVGVLNDNTSEFIDGAALSPLTKNSLSVFVGLTKAGNIECITTDEIVINNYNGAERRLDYGTVCKGISGITGVKELVDLDFYLGAWKNSGEFILLRPADPATGEPYDLFKNVKDPKLKAALENPSDHIGYFGMIKPLYPDGISDITYTYSAEYVDTGDFQDVVANVRKEHRVNGNIENSSDHLVVLFTNTSEWVYEAIDSGNLKYYTDKPLTSYKPAVYSNGDRATVTGWAIRWDVSKAKHKTWEYMREFKRNGDLEKSNAQRKVSALVFVKKPVE